MKQPENVILEVLRDGKKVAVKARGLVFQNIEIDKLPDLVKLIVDADKVIKPWEKNKKNG